MAEIINLSERHDSARRQARLPAVIRAPGVQSLATVTDLSPAGACIEAAAIPLPSIFVLEIDSAERVERICRIVWRDEQRVGVRFVNARTMGRSRNRRAPARETVTPYRSTAIQ